jgi:two-component system response regulator YesN
MDISKIHLLSAEIIEKIKQVVFYSPVIIYDVFEVITDILIYVLKKNSTNKEFITKFKNSIEKVSDSVVREETLINSYLQAITTLFDDVVQEKKNLSTLPIRQAKQYIRENFSKQISQEDVAEAIHLSPSYLSTMFKKEMGISFTDYLTSCRMEEAKKYLKKSTLSINEIAEKSGYADSKYFSRIFQKM